MYLKFSDKYWAIDIEGDLIPSTVVWCMAAVNIKTGEELTFVGREAVSTWINARKGEGCKFVGHNIIGYDAPTLNRLLGTRLGISDLIDTFLLSMIYSPGLVGGHSLEDWGVRLKDAKGVFNDFSRFSQEMLDYCIQDTRLARKIYLALIKRLTALGFTEQSIEIEHKAWAVLQKQRGNGFWFDIKEAHVLYAKLRQIENDIRDKIYEYWPPSFEVVATYKRPFKKDGSPSANYTRHCEQYERVDVRSDAGEYDCYDYVAFNIGSPPQRIEKLLELGWKPLPGERTKTGLPQPTKKGKLAPSLEKFVEESNEEGPRLIAQWIDVNARANMINTWIEAYNDESKCIHGSVWLAGTFRYRHSNPNMANIPAVRLDKEDHPLREMAGVFTYEARDLWQCRDRSTRRLVGVDAKGIQLRVLANYLNNEAFTRNILSADPHTANQKDFNLPTRALTKTITYAILMGAGDGRISSEARVPLKEAKATKELFFERLPELPNLIRRLKNELKKTGRISLCDGSKILVPSDHMVIPYLLQGDESKIMKRAMITISNECKRKKIDAIQVNMVHDELQYDVHKDNVEAFIAICLEAFLEAGRYFNYNLPTDGDAKVGYTWSETH